MNDLIDFFCLKSEVWVKSFRTDLIKNRKCSTNITNNLECDIFKDALFGFFRESGFRAC